MSLKQLKIRKRDGSVDYDDFGTVEDIVAIALTLAASGVKNPQLDSFIEFLTKLGRIPTAIEFEEWLKTVGARLVPIDGQIEPHEN